MLFHSVIAAAVMVGSVVAQTNSTRLDAGAAGLDSKITAAWCIGQRSACDTLCSKDAKINDCKSSDLSWNCECGDGSKPEDIGEYKDTIPYHICQESYSRCILANPDDAEGQTNCNDNIRDECGDKDIKDYKGSSASTTTTESSAATTTTAEVTQTTSAGGDDETAAAATSGATPTGDTSAPTPDSGASALKGSVVLAGVLAALGYML